MIAMHHGLGFAISVAGLLIGGLTLVFQVLGYRRSK